MGRLTKRFRGDVYIEDDCTIRKVLNKLAHYEDMEEQGKLIVVDKVEKELKQSTSTKYVCENGSVIITDVGYVEDWLKDYVKGGAV